MKSGLRLRDIYIKSALMLSYINMSKSTYIKNKPESDEKA